MVLHAASSAASIADIHANPSDFSLQAIAPQLEFQATFHNRSHRKEELKKSFRDRVLDMKQNLDMPLFLVLYSTPHSSIHLMVL